MANLETLVEYLLLAEGDNSEEEADYRGLHQASGKDGAPLWNVAQGVYPDDIYTLPLHTAAQYYGHGDSRNDVGVMSIIQRAHNKPKAKIRIYRAVPAVKSLDQQIAELEDQKRVILRRGKLPKGVNTTLSPSAYYNHIYDVIERLKARVQKGEEAPKPIDKINPGDWVTVWRPYAVDHGEGRLQGEYKILTAVVPASSLYTDSNSIYEFGWNP